MARVPGQRHGWLIIPGVQSGDRTLEEQMRGLKPALAEAKGRSVLDLGCAEGLIGREFARAGAVDVLGLDSVVHHIRVAKEQCAGFPMRFKVRDLNTHKPAKTPSWDIVLALAVLHKLELPERGTRYCAIAAKSLVVIRLPVGSAGLIVGKHSRVECDVRSVMSEQGFALERVEQGPREEMVQYWRRAK